MEAAEDIGSPSETERLVVVPLDPVKARRVVWIVLLVLAGLQAWTARFSITPDGISYIDLSDAVVSGHPARLINAYWSPLYPALLGIVRLILRPGPYWEFAALHLLNFLLFAASIGAFEFFLGGLRSVSAQWRAPELTTIRGLVTAYVIFGTLSLMMTPLSLPTPDLLVTTSSFLVFGALLRLRQRPDERRHAIALGVALAIGSLAKSFFIPWSLIVLAVAWVATRPSGSRSISPAIGIWVVVVASWCVALSVNQGRLTFGDTGRLTYVWNVNQVESPSLKLMPHGASTPAADSVLSGVAVTFHAQGTNPVWFDPARWYSGLKPRWNISQQLATFSNLVSQFFSTLAPVLLLLWLGLAVATRDARRIWWTRLWIIGVPALAAVGAYSLVLMTTRYIAPFLVALFIGVYFVLPWPSRLTPLRVTLGLLIPMLVVGSAPESGQVMSFLDAAAGAVLFAWGLRRFGPRGMVIAGALGGLALAILIPPELRSFGALGGVLVIASYWLFARLAIRSNEAHRFSVVVKRGLFIANGIIIAVVFAFKYKASIEPLQMLNGEPNLSSLIATAVAKAGITPGTRIAIVGSPFEAYWVRTAQLQIVGVVSPLRVAQFQRLSVDQRAVLYREFSRAGARFVVSQSALPPIYKDSTWVPYDLIGWVKRLPAR